MPSKDAKKCCHDDAVKAIKGAHCAQYPHRSFKHSCNIGPRQKATPTVGSRINNYNNYVLNGDTIKATQFLLNSNGMYGLCSSMKKKIDDAFKKRDREAAANNNTNGASNPAIGGGITSTSTRVGGTAIGGGVDTVAAASRPSSPGGGGVNIPPGNVVARRDPPGGGGGVAAGDPPPVARPQTTAIPLELVALLCCPEPWSQNRKEQQK